MDGPRGQSYEDWIRPFTGVVCTCVDFLDVPYDKIFNQVAIQNPRLFLGSQTKEIITKQTRRKTQDDAVSRLFIPIYLCVRDFRSQNSARARKERAFVLSSLECIDSSVCDRVLWVRQNVSLSGTGKLNCGQGMLPKIRMEKNVI